MSATTAAAVQKRQLDEGAALKALNVAREAFDDAGYDVSGPGEADAGEFYTSVDGVDIAVRIELL